MGVSKLDLLLFGGSLDRSCICFSCRYCDPLEGCFCGSLGIHCHNCGHSPRWTIGTGCDEYAEREWA